MKKILLVGTFFLLLSLAFSCVLKAQKKGHERDYKKKYEEAEYYFMYDNFHQAFPLFLELHYMDSTDIDVNHRLGLCYVFTMKDERGAKAYFESSKEKYPDAWFYLGQIYHKEENFTKALECYSRYNDSEGEKTYSAEEVNFYKTHSIVARKFQSAPFNGYIVKNLGGEINSPYSDYVPVISSDGNTMLFTSRREGSTGGKKDINGEYYEDIYISQNKLGKWSAPVNIGSPVNTATHDACISLSPDGQQLFVYRTDKGVIGGDIYTSNYVDGKWSKPELIEAEINSPDALEASACLSPDESIMYFSSDRKGGFGGLDLYYSKKLPNGQWAKPVNMGSTINTPYDEDAPFIHPDGKTMYFSSKGHENMGEFDIFKTVLLDDGIWSEPENLGYPVNSVHHDIYFVVTGDGRNAYFSSFRDGGSGPSDIYIANMPEENDNLIILKGTVATNDPVFSYVSATIRVFDAGTQFLQGIYRTNSSNGKYLLVLLPGKKYKVIIEAPGFINYEKEIDLGKRVDVQDMNRMISLKRKDVVQPADSLRIDDIIND